MARRKPRPRPLTAAQRLRAETPVFAAMQGPRELDKIGRGWNIVRDRAGRTLGEAHADLRDTVKAIDATWREQDKQGKELVPISSV